MIVNSTLDGSSEEAVERIKCLLILPGKQSFTSLANYEHTALDLVLTAKLDVGAWDFNPDDQPTVLKVLSKPGGNKYVTEGKSI